MEYIDCTQRQSPQCHATEQDQVQDNADARGGFQWKDCDRPAVQVFVHGRAILLRSSAVCWFFEEHDYQEHALCERPQWLQLLQEDVVVELVLVARVNPVDAPSVCLF